MNAQSTLFSKLYAYHDQDGLNAVKINQSAGNLFEVQSLQI